MNGQHEARKAESGQIFFRRRDLVAFSACRSFGLQAIDLLLRGEPRVGKGNPWTRMVQKRKLRVEWWDSAHLTPMAGPLKVWVKTRYPK